MFENLGVKIPDYEYKPDWYDKGYDHFIRNYWRYADDVDPKDMRVGDIVFFRSGSGAVNHAGIYVGWRKFAHAVDGHGVVLSRLNRRPWKEKFDSCCRVRGLDVV